MKNILVFLCVSALVIAGGIYYYKINNPTTITHIELQKDQYYILDDLTITNTTNPPESASILISRGGQNAELNLSYEELKVWNNYIFTLRKIDFSTGYIEVQVTKKE